MLWPMRWRRRFGAIYVMDRGYIDFERLYLFTTSAASPSDGRGAARNPGKIGLRLALGVNWLANTGPTF